MSQTEKIRGIDFVTIEIFGLNQGFLDETYKCQELLEENGILKDFDFEVLQHRKGTGYIDVALYPKNGDKRKFINDVKKWGFGHTE
jgi:hypothetical protein